MIGLGRIYPIKTGSCSCIALRGQGAILVKQNLFWLCRYSVVAFYVYLVLATYHSYPAAVAARFCCGVRLINLFVCTDWNSMLLQDGFGWTMAVLLAMRMRRLKSEGSAFVPVHDAVCM